MKITYTPQPGDPRAVTVGGVLFASGVTIETDDPVILNNCQRNASFFLGDPAALKLDRVLNDGIKQLKEPLRMASLSVVSDRIKTKKEAHQAKADEWGAQLDAMDKLEPELFASGDAAISERQADMDELKANFHGLTNIAKPTSDGSANGSGATVTATKGEK